MKSSAQSRWARYFNCGWILQFLSLTLFTHEVSGSIAQEELQARIQSYFQIELNTSTVRHLVDFVLEKKSELTPLHAIRLQENDIHEKAVEILIESDFENHIYFQLNEMIIGTPGSAKIAFRAMTLEDGLPVARIIRMHSITQKCSQTKCDCIERFENELKYSKTIHELAPESWTGLVKVLGIGPNTVYQKYYTMDLMDVFELPEAKKWSDLEKIQSLCSLATGLVTLHSLGVVHNDIKLENIFVDPVDGAVLADFDLMASAEQIANLQKRNHGGTAKYVPPEFASATIWATSTKKTRSELLRKGDVYSLGLVGAILFDPAWAGQQDEAWHQLNKQWKHRLQQSPWESYFALNVLTQFKVDSSNKRIKYWRNNADFSAIESILGRAIQADPIERVNSTEFKDRICTYSKLLSERSPSAIEGTTLCALESNYQTNSRKPLKGFISNLESLLDPAQLLIGSPAGTYLLSPTKILNGNYLLKLTYMDTQGPQSKTFKSIDPLNLKTIQEELNWLKSMNIINEAYNNPDQRNSESNLDSDDLIGISSCIISHHQSHLSRPV